MTVDSERLNAVISQRMKLACKGMAYADMDTVLMGILSQNRRISREEQRRELQHVRQLSIHAQGLVADFRQNGREMFIKQIEEMELSDRQLAQWLSIASAELKKTANEKRMNGWESLGVMCADLEQVAAHFAEGSENHMDRAYLTGLLGRCLSEKGLESLAAGSLSASDKAEVYSIERLRNSLRKDSSLAAVALRKLRREGRLPIEWAAHRESEIICHVSEDWSYCSSDRDAMVSLMGECMSAKTLLMMGSGREHCRAALLEKYEEEMEYRQIAIAAFLNLKYSKRLGYELEAMSDEDLAVLVCSAAELDYYHAGLTRGSLNVETVMLSVAMLLFGLMCGLIGVFYGSIGDVVCGLFGLFYVVGAAYAAWKAVMLVVDELCPAGFSETALGVKLNRGLINTCDWIEKMCERLAELIRNFTGGGGGAGAAGMLIEESESADITAGAFRAGHCGEEKQTEYQYN